MVIRTIFIKGKILTVSNIITLIRAVLIIPAVFVMFYFDGDTANIAFTGIIATGIFTDLIDGSIARLFNQVTPLGRLLDPTVDKLCLTACFIILFLKRDLPGIYLFLIIFRDLSVFSGGLFIFKKQDKLATSNIYGKMAVLIISISVLFYIFDWKIYLITKDILFKAGLALFYFSGFSYIHQMMTLKKKYR